MHTLARSPVREAGLKFKADTRAFTLIELLTVIGIIAILAGITFGVVKGVQERAAIGQAKVELAVLAQALEAYKLQYGDYPQIGRYTTATAPTAASNSNQPGLLFNALMGKLGPINNTFNNTLGKAFVEPSKLSTINADYPAASGNTLVANAFIDPWGRAYLYSYRTSATGGGGWLKPSYYLYSVGPTNNHDAPDATGTVNYETANNADNLYAKR